MAELIEVNNRGDTRFPQVALDATGNAVAVWLQSDGSSNSVWANRWLAQ